MMNQSTWQFVLRVVLIGLLTMTGVAVAAPADIMVQGFGWNSTNGGVPSKWYNLVGDRAKDLGDMGFTLIWLPPVSRSVSPQGYLPGDYYDLGTQNSPTFYGCQEQLEGCLGKLNAAGVKPIADIVVNHRCAGKQDANGIWNLYHFSSGKAKWDQWGICRGEYGGTGAADTGDNYQAAPDVDHTNAQVQEDIAAWMNWLKKIGFAGWRYDFVKGYAPKYNSLYDQKTSPAFSVGELWTDMSFHGSHLNPNQDAHRQKLCDWLNGAGTKATIFDFTTKGILQVAVMGEYWRLKDEKGKASGLIGWWPERAVTFIDNHDTGSQQSHWPFPGEKVMQGYAYILTHPGVPCVFWEHIYDWKLRDPVKKLMRVRQSYGLKATSKLEIVKAEKGLYAAIIDDKVAMKIGWLDWAPPAPYTLLTSGDQFAVWGKPLDKPLQRKPATPPTASPARPRRR
jgi:alpha-amylase